MFTVPTIFEAIDRLTAPLGNMGGAVTRFAQNAETGIAKAQGVLKKFTPSLSTAGEQLLSYAKSAAIAGGIVSTVIFSANQVKDYESAVASFRTIVSDLNNKDFKKYRLEIMDVADATKKSSVDVAKNFEVIAGLNAKYAETAEGLGQVSAATITLARASNTELEPAAQSLVGIMNQYGAAANQANRYINVLAAGQAVGAASIQNLSESFVNVGSTLAGANESIEGGTALLEVLASKMLLGAEAGTKLRGSILKLQQGGVGYASGQFKIIDALEQVKKQYDSLQGAKAKDAYLNKLFGAENVSTGRILLTNIQMYKDFTQSVTGTSEAQKAAAINANTLANRIDELKNKWVNLITGNDKANESLEAVKKLLVFITDHLDSIVTVGTYAIAIYGTMWGVLTIGNGIIKTLIGLQWLWNIAMAANPAVLIIAAIILALTALGAMIYMVIDSTKGWSDQWETTKTFILKSLDILKFGFLLAWLKIEDGFLTMVDGLVKAWKWTQNKLGLLSDEQYAKDIARIKAEQDLRTKGLLETKTALFEAMDAADKAFTWKVKMKDGNDRRAEKWESDNTPYPSRTYPALNPKTAQNDAVVNQMNNVVKQLVEININDNTGKAETGRTNGPVPVKLTKTIGVIGG